MDFWGIALIIIFGVVWLVARKRQNKLASFAVLMVGVGIGILVGAIWAMSIVNSVFP